jgi:putative membrane protein
MLYLFLYTLPCSLVGALITLSGDVLYRPYAAARLPWGVSPLGDQQIGGLEMWIGGSIYYFLAFMVVWFIWASQDEPETPRLFLLKGSRGS